MALDFNLQDFLTPGVEPDDVPTLWALVRARPMVDTFITLFRGGEEEVFIRLHVLREIGARADLPRWLPEELRRHFSYIETIKLETVLKRLRENGLMAFGEDGTYQLSDAGRNAVAAVSALLRFGENEDAELGFLTTQLAGMQATGTLTPEMLQHLLAKLNALTASFEDAIASGSEFRILDARSRLSSNIRWLDKGTQILRSLLTDDKDEDGDVTPDIARTAHAIGLAQSRLARVDAAFQRALNKIESQRVTLGASGVSSSDAAAWLRSLDIRRIAALADGAMGAGPRTQFVAGGHELLDRAESALSEEVRQMEADSSLPPSEEAPTDQANESEDLSLLTRLSEKLSGIPTAAPAQQLILGGGFGPASYRLSLLSLLGNEEAQAEGPVADLTQMPYDLLLESYLVEVMEDEVSHISAGNVVRRGA
ncbi:hypothetical protein VVD49_18845 [Uliginosibacterium sp. H3]|uniref:DUF3375 domain-containing protein n=1 Tax=Uliginosibacterium silvisoli TaxID=3114758 RepID=A0ABU6K7E3_9RHOO|nr:hypothetical protein [Uliginosibacterium sp. H3]